MKIKLKQNIINYSIEFIFIFSSVYFAFWLTKQGEEAKIKKIERQAVTMLHNELKENAIQLEKSFEYHKEITENLSTYADSVHRGLIDAEKLRPIEHIKPFFYRRANSLGFPNIKEIAWQTLQNSEAYVYLDYKLASELGELYYIQDVGVKSTAKGIINDIFNSKSYYQREESEAIVIQTAYYFNELKGQEEFLLYFTNKAIESLENHYDFLKDSEGE